MLNKKERLGFGDVMDKVLFSIFIFAYLAAVIILMFKVKQYLTDTPTIPNKLYVIACSLIYAALFLYYTSSINDGVTIVFRGMNGEPLSFAGALVYVFYWFLFWVLNSSILTVILFIPHTFYIFAKYPNITWRSKQPKELNVDMWPSMYVTGAALAYNLILYAFSLTDNLHLSWFF